MIRALFALQAAYFLCFGLAAGAAFTFVTDAMVAQAELRATAAVYATLPLSALAEIRI